MKISISLFVLFTVVIGVMMYVKRLRVAAFLVSAVWGFLLAQTTAASSVQTFLSGIARLFGAS